MKRLRIAVLLALLGGCVLLAWAAFQPVPPLQIAVRVLGYTNDATGMRWAVIGVTNVGMMKSFVYRPTIEVESAGAPRGSWCVKSTRSEARWRASLTSARYTRAF